MRTQTLCLLLVLNAAALASARPDTITTYAGGGPVNGPALAINVAPQGVAATVDGDVYFISTDRAAVYKLSGDLVILIAGTPGIRGFSGDGGSATGATLNDPRGVAVDGSGNVYVADTGNSRVRKVLADTGVIATVAGNGSFGYRGDGGPATSASLFYMSGVAVDGSGNLYIAENNRIRRVSAGTGVITTVADNGTYGFGGDGGPAISATFSYLNGIAVDADGNLYVADSGNYRVRKISALTGVITTVAGNGTYAYGGSGYIGDEGPATSASVSPGALAVDDSGNLYIADNNRIRKVSADTGVITTVAGNGSYNYGDSGSIGDGGPATSASFSSITGVGVDGNGSLYIADSGNNRIRKVSADTSLIITAVGNGRCCYSGDGGPATGASFSQSNGVAVDSGGSLYIADSNNYRVRKVSAGTSMVTTVAGNGNCCNSSGDGGPAIDASLSYPNSVAVDDAGNLYIAESNRIRKVAADTGVITTVAGNGSCCSPGGGNGDGGPATSATLSPSGVAVDGNRNLYITESSRVRKVPADTGVISTVAGNESYGYSGDGGPATSASLSSPRALAADRNGDFYIVDNNRIRKVSADTGLITTVAGNDTYGFSGDGGPAISASLNYPGGVAVDDRGNLYIADSNNQRVREVFATTGIIATIAGNGSYGFRGDNGPAVTARLASPSAVAVDSIGSFYMLDSGNQRIRKVDGRIATTMLVTSNANPTTTQNLVLTTAVSPSDATGSVQFFDGVTALGKVELSAGTVTLSEVSLTVGTHSFVAVYSGDGNHAMSTSPALLQGVSFREISTLALTCDAQTKESYGLPAYVSALHSPVTFTATLAAADATGTVQFLDGSASLGVQAIAGGTAVLTTSSLPAGIHRISAVYSGDASFLSRRVKAIRLEVFDTASADNTNASLSSR